MSAVPRTSTFACSTAGASWTTFIPVINDNYLGLEVRFTGLTSDAKIWARAANYKDASTAQDLTQTYATMVAAAGSVMFNIRDMAYNWLVLYFDDNGNGTGTMQLITTRKSDV